MVYNFVLYNTIGITIYILTELNETPVKFWLSTFKLGMGIMLFYLIADN